MSTRTKVSKQVKVTQGGRIATFELTKKGLAIDIAGHLTTGEAVFILKGPGIDALKELLNVQTIAKVIEGKAAQDIAKRFTMEDQPSRPETAPTEDGLERADDGIVGGME